MARLTVVLSQAPGKHPAKRALEESVVAALLLEPGLEVSVVPNLYDLGPDHTGRLFLDSVRSDLVILSWHYPRAAFWLLDRDGIKGHMGEVQLKPPVDEEDEEAKAAPEDRPAAIGATGAIPERHIYCLDLRDANKADPFLREIRRIAAECNDRRDARARERAANSPAILQLGLAVNGSAGKNDIHEAPPPAFAPDALLAPAGRRWYPVIDYNRCTNCLECLDFCLFGVYGVDGLERILVENQDQCKKGCPACSRVCPQQAIIFPEFKTPAIAGADTGAVGSLKIDLSKLFGGDVADALAVAVLERDRELVNDGREAVGMAIGVPKRQEGKPQGPKDDLDRLVDDLDNLGL